ncbi:MAG: BrnT family toxin [Pseudomonadales bacterium]|nr:BrnT family toxin [Pseudomonadales bacterium]
MDYEFDPAKDRINQKRHGISLSEAGGFEWDTAVIREDRRYHYSEQRFEATGYIGLRLRVMVYCERGGVTRVISLRFANKREEKRYAET